MVKSGGKLWQRRDYSNVGMNDLAIIHKAYLVELERKRQRKRKKKLVIFNVKKLCELRKLIGMKE